MQHEKFRLNGDDKHNGENVNNVSSTNCNQKRVKLFEELADISFGLELAEEFFAQH